MNSPEQYNEIELPNGCSVKVYDHTRVYFGDYHHVRLEVVCVLSLREKSDKAGIAVETPDQVVYSRFLEKMAVPSAAVDDVRQSLLAEFRKNSLHYLAAADFPAKLAAKIVGQQKIVSKRYTENPAKCPL